MVTVCSPCIIPTSIGNDGCFRSWFFGRILFSQCSVVCSDLGWLIGV